MYQAVANDGVRVPPRIVEATIGADGVRTPSPTPEGVRVMTPETARTMRDMLQSVTQDGRGGNRGTGPQAAIPGYPVAGKTGTAQQVDPGCGCYSQSNYWITFAGMFPAQDPRYVVALMLDRPPGGDSARAAVPRHRRLSRPARGRAGVHRAAAPGAAHDAVTPAAGHRACGGTTETVSSLRHRARRTAENHR